MRIFNLKTVDTWSSRGADHFRIIETDDGYVTLRMSDPDITRYFRSVDRALFTLGGMVPWESWSADTLELLKDLNNGKMI